MTWQDHIYDEKRLALPYVGGFRRKGRSDAEFVTDGLRVWEIAEPSPPEYGWYEFDVRGRVALCLGPMQQPTSFGESLRHVEGYLVGDRLIRDSVPVPVPLYLVDPTLDLFTLVRALALPVDNGAVRCIYLDQMLPAGPEIDVFAAYHDRQEAIDHVKGVAPVLDRAFRFAVQQRAEREALEAERARLRADALARLEREARIERARKDAGSALGRRLLAEVDFRTAASIALREADAEFLSHRPSSTPGEMVVQFRFRRRRWECVVDAKTLGIIDSGICMRDHETGRADDRLLTLESLPGTLGQAIDTDKLVVYRRV